MYPAYLFVSRTRVEILQSRSTHAGDDIQQFPLDISPQRGRQPGYLYSIAKAYEDGAGGHHLGVFFATGA